MRSDDQVEWWIDESALPDLIWAFVRALPHGSAETFDADGRTRHFDSGVAAANWLSEDEYVRPSSIEAGALARLGLNERELRPPVGETDSDLIPQMCRRLDCADALRDLSAVNWLKPWALPVPSERDAFEAELRRELHTSHSLHARDARAFLRRVDRDDVLFVVSRPVELAVVHLTYTKQPPDRPPWPRAETYDQVWKFVDRTHRDAAEHEAG
jgi:hypothetical protein